MKMRNAIVMLGIIAIVAAVGISSFLPDAQAAPKAKQGDKGQVEIQLVLDPGEGGSAERMVTAISNIGSSGQDGVRSTFIVDSFFDISYYAANIGSSGLDGVSFDSFFDITYSTSAGNRTVQTEMISMSLTGSLSNPDNPGEALDAIRAAVTKARGVLHHGHVTILK
jgi:hypothetical protein